MGKYHRAVPDPQLEIQMLLDRVLVRISPEDGERRSSGGIVIPIVFAENDPATGTSNVIVVEPAVGGMGARFGHDGVDGRDSSIANLANNPIETIEGNAQTLASKTMYLDEGKRLSDRWPFALGTTGNCSVA